MTKNEDDDCFQPFSFRKRQRGPTARIGMERLGLLEKTIIQIVREEPGLSVHAIEKRTRARGQKFSISVIDVTVERLVRQRRIQRTISYTARNRVLKHYARTSDER